MIYNNIAVFTYESNIFHKNGQILGKLDNLYFLQAIHLVYFEQNTTFKLNIYYFKPSFNKTIIIIFLLQHLHCFKRSTK